MKTKMNKKWVVCFAEFQSDSTVYTMTHILRRFHREGHPLLWINSIPNRGIFSGKGGYSKGTFKRYLNKLLIALIPLRKKEQGFYVLTPFFLPWLENKKIIALNDVLIKIQLRLTFLILGIRKFLLCSSSMMNTPFFFKKRSFECYFHYVGDLYSDYRNASTFVKDRMYQRENAIFNFADKILIASNRVFKKIEVRVEDKSKLVYFPHGVEFQHFNTKVTPSPAMTGIKKPIIGYFGSLTDANDKDAILNLASNGFSVALIGKVSGDYEECKKYANVHFLGPVPYKELPSYAQAFDLCMLNWEMAEWIKNCNPQKMYEYLAMGKAIVSCRIPEAEYQLSEYIYFADKADDYASEAKKALTEDSYEKREKRMIRAKKEDWDNKFLFVKSLFNLD